MKKNNIKSILMTAYDVDPYKGGESQIGWKIPFSLSKDFNIILVTRRNNSENIFKYVKENNINTDQIKFLFYDLPYILRFWKRGARGSGIYFYLWQMFMPLYLYLNKVDFDVAHSVNFVSDSYPHFLWITGKPSIWGPISHHEKIFKDAISFYGFKENLKDKILWSIKKYLWKFDVFHYLSKKYSHKILVSNSSVKMRLNLDNDDIVPFSSSAIEKLPNLGNKNLQSNNVNFLIVARAVPLKSIDIAINAFNEFKKINPNSDAKLNIVGGGKYLSKLKKLASNLDSSSFIYFLDTVNYEELDLLYRNASIFLCPSHEGGGLAVIEAMSYGLPVICFNNYGPGEATCNQSAIRVNYENYTNAVADFSNAMFMLTSNPQQLELMSNAAIERVSNNFLWSTRANVLKEIYNDL